jgi:hypothetical protein
MTRIAADATVAFFESRTARDPEAHAEPAKPFHALIDAPSARVSPRGNESPAADKRGARDAHPRTGQTGAQAPSARAASASTSLEAARQNPSADDHASLTNRPDMPAPSDPFTLPPSSSTSPTATRFDANGLLTGHCAGSAFGDDDTGSAPHERDTPAPGPVDLVAVPAGTSDETDGRTPTTTPHRPNAASLGHGPAIVPRASLQLPATPAFAPATERSNMAVDESPPEPAPAGRLAGRLSTMTAALNPILVALHEVEDGHRLLARLGALDPDEAERLRDGIAALLASHGIHRADVTIVASPPISSN